MAGGAHTLQSLTLQYDKVLFILDPSETAQSAIGKRVTVVDYPDGRIAIRYQGEERAYRTFDKIRRVNQAAIVENKRLGALVEMIKLYQESEPAEQRSRKAPKRRDQTGQMSAPLNGGRALRDMGSPPRPPTAHHSASDISIWRKPRHL